MTESRHFQKDGDSCPEGACGSTMHITLTIEVTNPNVLKVVVDLESNVEDARLMCMEALCIFLSLLMLFMLAFG